MPEPGPGPICSASAFVRAYHVSGCTGSAGRTGGSRPCVRPITGADETKTSAAGAGRPQERVRVVIEQLVQGMLQDVHFVSILLSEAVTFTRIEEKGEQLTDLVYDLVRSLVGSRRGPALSRRELRTALVVVFLGVMSTARIARASSFGIADRDVIRFVRTLARESLGLAS